METCLWAEFSDEQGVYDAAILKYYTEEEFEELNSYIDHDRDLRTAYAGLRPEYLDKYLYQDIQLGQSKDSPVRIHVSPLPSSAVTIRKSV